MRGGRRLKDVEEVIAAYDCKLDIGDGRKCSNCPYGYSRLIDFGVWKAWRCDVSAILDDAVEMLKQKIPARVGYSFDGDLICGSCHYILDKKYDTCPKCGRGLKW